jgi:hypothetical protein
LHIEEILPSICSIASSLSSLVPPIDYPETWQTPFRPKSVLHLAMMTLFTLRLVSNTLVCATHLQN